MQNRNQSLPEVLRKAQRVYCPSRRAFPAEAAVPPLASMLWLAVPTLGSVALVHSLFWHQALWTFGYLPFKTALSCLSWLLKLILFFCFKFTQQPTDGSDTMFVLIKPKSCTRLKELCLALVFFSCGQVARLWF